MSEAHCNHSHLHHSAISKYSGALAAATAINLLYVLVEIFFGITQGSLALLTDAGHNLGDVFTLAISLLAFFLAAKKPTKRYTYGYKKLTILVALANAVLLLIAVAVIWYNAIERIYHPQEVSGYYITLVAAIGFVVNATSALFFLKHKDKELNMKGAYLHLLADAAVSLGVVISGLIITYTQYFWIDTAVSFIVGSVILYGTWGLLRDTVRLSIDGVPHSIDYNHIEQAILTTEGVIRAENIHIWAISTTETALTASVFVNNSFSFTDAESVRHLINHKLEHLGICHTNVELRSEKN